MRRASGLLIFVLGLCAWCFKGVDGTELGGAGDGSCGVSRVHAGAAVSLRLRGGTGQGGPSRGFRSKGSSMKWRHPHTLFLRAQNQKPEPRPQERLANSKTGRSKASWGKPCAEQRVKRKKLNLFVEGDSYHTMIQVRNLRKARQYEYFNLADPDYQPAPKLEHVWYDYKALIKKPRCMKVGPKGYGRPPYDFTNRYIGGPKQV